MNKPLIDGGSTGLIGSTTSVVKDKTSCYECIEKPTPKQFPVCTIRSTPDKMIHCIVWAKLLLSALFGPKEDATFLDDIKTDLEDIVAKNDFQLVCKTIYNKVFDTDIKDQLSLLAKKNEALDDKQKEVIEKLGDRKINVIDSEHYLSEIDIGSYCKSPVIETRAVHDIPTYSKLLFHCIMKIMSDAESYKIGCVQFDKDDHILMDFVTAASNLRAYNYSINFESQFKVKEIAGNIVPAVSSTNGLVAALEVIEGMKILHQSYDILKAITFQSKGDKRKISSTTIQNDRNPNCVICSNTRLMVKLTVNADTYKLEDFIALIR